jgi:hypothetical protein
LMRAEHIAGRFGEAATRQMLSTLGAQLRLWWVPATGFCAGKVHPT